MEIFQLRFLCRLVQKPSAAVLPSTLEQIGCKILLATIIISPCAGSRFQADGRLAWVYALAWADTDRFGRISGFSHGDFVKLDDSGLHLKSLITMVVISFGPEDNMDIAQKLGADIVMQLISVRLSRRKSLCRSRGWALKSLLNAVECTPPDWSLWYCTGRCTFDSVS